MTRLTIYLRKSCIILLLFLKLLCAPLMVMAKPLTGLASYYGKQHAGRRMANGQIFDPKQMTCAHRSLPFGTRLRVFCQKTGRAIHVIVTDRGPFKKARVLDLSQAAAHALGIERMGVARVEFEKE